MTILIKLRNICSIKRIRSLTLHIADRLLLLIKGGLRAKKY